MVGELMCAEEYVVEECTVGVARDGGANFLACWLLGICHRRKRPPSPNPSAREPAMIP